MIEYNQLESELNSNFSSKISIKTFTHDYYILELPERGQNKFYQQFPFYLEETDFRGLRIKMAPVARIYGSNQFGQKCCCHIHGFFPYFYIKALDYSDAFNDPEFLKNFLDTLQNLYQRAYQINKPIILKGTVQYKHDFYGYHEKPQCFLKIILYDPGYAYRMRELLDSKILCNRSFQCYEAHINYFMQLFSEQNVYGINQMSIFGFTFRKNMNSDLMDLFKKISINDKVLNSKGWDLITIQKIHPQAFNTLHKISSCYIQIDFHVNAILNHFQSEMQEQELRSSDDEDVIQDPNKRKFKVKITKALQQIWSDEKRRRSHYGIKKKPKGEIDFTKNIEAHYSIYQKDPMWINFLRKGKNYEDLIEMIKTSVSGTVPPQTQQLWIARQIAQNYNKVLFQERQQLIDKVHQRWKYYGSRKINHLNKLMEGQKNQIPSWQDDEHIISSDSEKSQDLNEQQEEDVNIQIKSNTTIKKQPPGNTILYRGKFNHVKSSLRKDSLFYICQYCKKTWHNCFCKQANQELQNQKTVSKNKAIQRKNIQTYEFNESPPLISQCLETIEYENQKPFYSNPEDLLCYYKIDSQFEPSLKNTQFLERQLRRIKQFDRDPITLQNKLKLPEFYQIDQLPEGNNYLPKTYTLQFQEQPPSHQEVLNEYRAQNRQKQAQQSNFRRSTSIMPNKNASFLSDLLVIHYDIICDITNPKMYYADPERDPIICLIYQIANFQNYDYRIKGIIILQKYFQMVDMTLIDDIFLVKDQFSLLTIFINLVFRIDPDLLITYDQQKKGIRYLVQRGYLCGIDLQQVLSRSSNIEEMVAFINFRDFKMAKQSCITRSLLLSGNLLENKKKHKHTHQLQFLQKKLKEQIKKKPVLRKKYRFDIDIKGRVNLNIYRICQSELKLRSYTIEAVSKHLFGEQFSEFTDQQISGWLKQSPEKAEYALEYIQDRLTLQSKIIINLNILSVVIEKSKIFGADFISMMQRGSQFKIQTVMCRVTKKSGYLTLSATKKQVANQSVLECYPLVIQPPKQFYSDPVLLFDFQSLYPSVMIAYNICYSTCLGSVNNLFDKNKNKRFGVSEKMNIDVSWLEEIITKCQKEDLLTALDNYIFISPNRVAFIKKNIKEGIIPRILLQFLISRIMIKQSSSLYSKEKVKSLLKNRQIALKLFMNVMFGYTGASFSGRMPCSEIADSVVQIAKYSLRKVIDFLNEHPRYKGKVLYGDTDSVFFHLPGYKIKQAIEIGKKLAVQMTSLFPYPMEMKFQKAYDGLFLVSKKRYYGKSYEDVYSAPKYEGKGLECVRRDGIQLTSELMKQMLNLLIETKDLSLLKQKFQKECSLILGDCKLQSQFSLAKQVKLIKYTEKYIPGHGEAARRLQKIDPMLVPKYGQRMKYFVVKGGLKAVKNRSIAVFQYSINKNMSLDSQYYLNKQVIPPLQRALSSLVNLKEWTYKNSDSKAHNSQNRNQKLNLQGKCLRCQEDAYFVVCEKCFSSIDEEIEKIEKQKTDGEYLCQVCTGNKLIDFKKCVEWNCKQLWNRKKITQRYESLYSELSKLKHALVNIQF